MRKLLITINTFLLSLLLVCSCNMHERQAEKEQNPLHDSIDDAIDKMQWERCMMLIDKGERVSKDNLERWDMELLKAKAYFRFGKPSEMKELLDSLQPLLAGKEQGGAEDRLLFQHYLHSRMAYYAQYTNEVDSMLFYGKWAKQMALETGDYREAVISTSNLADVYRQMGMIDDAIAEYDEGIRLNDSLCVDSSLYLPMYSGMACSFNVLHNEIETNKWLDRMLTLHSRMTVLDSIAYYTQKGNSLYFAEKYKESLGMFLKYDSLLRHHQDMNFDRIVCDVNLADDYIHLGQDDKVGNMLDHALDFFAQNGITAYAPYVHTLQIQHLLNQDKYAEALTLARSVEDEIPTMNPDHRAARYKVMALCMKKNDMLSQEGMYDHEYHELNDSLRNAQSVATTSEIESRYARDSQMKERYIERQQRDLKDMQLYVVLLVLVIAIFMIVVVHTYYVRRTRKRRRLAVSRILSLRGEILRNRLTPHFISNALALGHDLSQDDMDNIILLIREALSYDDSLTESLDREMRLTMTYIRVASLMYRGKIVTECDIDESVNQSDYLVPAMSLLTIVENAIKHGEADDDGELHITVSLHKRNHCVCLEITNSGTMDDGHAVHDRAWHGIKMIHQTVDILNKQRNGLEYSFSMHNAEDNHHVVSQILIKLPNL